MCILVNDVSGFIVSHLVEHFQESVEVAVLDNLCSGYRSNLDGFFYRFISASVTDRAAVEAAMDGGDLVFRLAAMNSVLDSMDAPCECTQNNVFVLLNVLLDGANGVKNSSSQHHRNLWR